MEVHGGSKDEKLIDFSISVNPYTPRWKDDLFKRCEKIANRYLYTEWLEDEFRKKFGQNTVILAGATEAFQIAGLSVMNGANVIIPSPSYGEYERVASYGAKNVMKIPPKGGIELDTEMAFALADKKVKDGRTVLILGNPNNPTGKYLNFKEEITTLGNDGVTIILDEAFVDFVDEKKIWHIDHPNVITVRSFTKSYGMPGIRVGYVKNDEFKRHFEKYRSPWAIGSCGYAFVEFLIEDDGTFLKESVGKIRGEAKRFENFGLLTDANFGSLKVKNASEIQQKLDGSGIHVRSCESFGLKDRIRLSIRTPEENDHLFEALEKVIG
jgi:histidinol-phosphate aminotransferase